MWECLNHSYGFLVWLTAHCIIFSIFSPGKALEELAKDKPQMKSVENHTSTFVKTLEGVGNGLMKQINYLTQVSTGKSLLTKYTSQHILPYTYD